MKKRWSRVGIYREQKNNCLSDRKKHPRFQKEARDVLIIHSTGQAQSMQEGKSTL